MIPYFITITLNKIAVQSKPGVRSEAKKYLVIDVYQDTNKVLFINDEKEMDFVNLYECKVVDLLTYKEADKIINDGAASILEVKHPAKTLTKPVAKVANEKDK